MLLQWRKPITIVLTPDNITIKSGGKKQQTIEVTPSQTDKLSWDHVIAELEQQATTLASKNVSIIMSNHYVRYAVLPWQSNIYSHQDWQSLAENHLRAIHGNVVDNWKVSIAMQGYGKPLVVSAMDQLFLSRLQELATQFNWSIESVEPALVAISHRYASQIQNNDMLMMVEGQRIVLVEMDAGHITAFSMTNPPVEHESVEASKLIIRTAKLNPSLSNTVCLFSERQLRLEGLDNIRINSLVAETDNSTMSAMLAALK